MYSVFHTSFILQPYHMSAAALNAFHNIWLKHATNNKELTLDVNNHPLPRTAEAEVRVYIGNNIIVCV